MNRPLVFGDVIRIDPANTLVSHPDNRRWMVVSFDDRLKWTVLFIGPSAMSWPNGATLSHFTALTGFKRVDE